MAGHVYGNAASNPAELAASQTTHAIIRERRSAATVDNAVNSLECGVEQQRDSRETAKPLAARRQLAYQTDTAQHSGQQGPYRNLEPETLCMPEMMTDGQTPDSRSLVRQWPEDSPSVEDDSPTAQQPSAQQHPLEHIHPHTSGFPQCQPQQTMDGADSENSQECSGMTGASKSTQDPEADIELVEMPPSQQGFAAMQTRATVRPAPLSTGCLSSGLTPARTTRPFDASLDPVGPMPTARSSPLQAAGSAPLARQTILVPQVNATGIQPQNLWGAAAAQPAQHALPTILEAMHAVNAQLSIANLA